MMRRRSVLLKLATPVLLAFALTSHFARNGAVDAYKLGQFRLRYPTTVNDDEPQQQLQQVESAAPSYFYYPQKQQPQQQSSQQGSQSLFNRDYDYETLREALETQNGYNSPPQETEPQMVRQQAPTGRWSDSISLNGENRLSKYKNFEENENDDKSVAAPENDREIQEQIQSILRSLYDLGRVQSLEQQQQQRPILQRQSQHPAKLQQALPQPIKKENTENDPVPSDTLESELFRMQNKPLEDAETMIKDTDSGIDNGSTDLISSGTIHLPINLNQESVDNQNYRKQNEILKRKLIQSSGSAALLKNDPHEATYQHYRQMVQPVTFQQSIDGPSNGKQTFLASISDIYFVAMVVCVSSVAICSVIGAGYCFYKVQQNNRQAADVEFPAYGVIGPNGNGDCSGLGSLNGSAATSKCASPPADRKLTQAAQMYHYQHQKQQMISNERNVVRVSNHGTANSDLDSDEENEDGEYTVYECPGLAPTGEMEVKNPLFQDDLTPMSSPSVVNGKPQATSAKK